MVKRELLNSLVKHLIRLWQDEVVLNGNDGTLDSKQYFIASQEGRYFAPRYDIIKVIESNSDNKMEYDDEKYPQIII